MNIFITGATGFVGSFVLRKLLAETNHRIAILCRSDNTHFRIKELIPKVISINGDLSDSKEYEESLIRFHPDVVIHLAWQGVLGSERNSVEQCINISHSIQLIQACQKAQVKKFIGLGSQAEYGPCENRIDESHQCHPTTLYGASKLASFILTKQLCAEFKIDHAWLRLFSSYGPGDNDSWLIPYVIRSLLDGKKPALTLAEQYWDFIYVEDAASAIISLVEKDGAIGLFNLGSGSAVQLGSIIKMIRNAIDPKLGLGFGEIPYRHDQVMHLEADIRKLTNTTGWTPIHDLKSSIFKTIDWYSKEK